MAYWHTCLKCHKLTWALDGRCANRWCLPNANAPRLVRGARARVACGDLYLTEAPPERREAVMAHALSSTPAPRPGRARSRSLATSAGQDRPSCLRQPRASARPHRRRVTFAQEAPATDAALELDRTPCAFGAELCDGCLYPLPERSTRAVGVQLMTSECMQMEAAILCLQCRATLYRACKLELLAFEDRCVPLAMCHPCRTAGRHVCLVPRGAP